MPLSFFTFFLLFGGGGGGVNIVKWPVLFQNILFYNFLIFLGQPELMVLLVYQCSFMIAMSFSFIKKMWTYLRNPFSILFAIQPFSYVWKSLKQMKGPNMRKGVLNRKNMVCQGDWCFHFSPTLHSKVSYCNVMKYSVSLYMTPADKWFVAITHILPAMVQLPQAPPTIYSQLTHRQQS